MSSDLWPMVAGIGAGVAATAAIVQAITSGIQVGSLSAEDREIQDLQKRVAALEAQLKRRARRNRAETAGYPDATVPELERITMDAKEIAEAPEEAEKDNIALMCSALEDKLKNMGLVDERSLPKASPWYVSFFERRGAAFLGI